jgi:hypothetical protein
MPVPNIRRWGRRVVALVVAPLLGIGVLLAGPQRGARTLELVPLGPGTVVGSSAPPGWTDLVIKSLPELDSGDLASLPAVGRSSAALFRPVLVADVRKAPWAPRRFSLERLGVGLCVPVQGVDTVVTPDGPPEALATLGFVGRQVLGRAEGEVKKDRVLVGTPDFALLEAPAVLKSGRGHLGVVLLYAFLVDSSTGRLRTLIWAVAADPAARSDPEAMIFLPRGQVDRCGLDVAAVRRVGPVTYDWSFAMRSLPTGRRLELPDDLRAWAGDPRRITADPDGFATRLRERLGSNPPP